MISEITWGNVLIRHVLAIWTTTGSTGSTGSFPQPRRNTSVWSVATSSMDSSRISRSRSPSRLHRSPMMPWAATHISPAQSYNPYWKRVKYCNSNMENKTVSNKTMWKLPAEKRALFSFARCFHNDHIVVLSEPPFERLGPHRLPRRWRHNTSKSRNNWLLIIFAHWSTSNTVD